MIGSPVFVSRAIHLAGIDARVDPAAARRRLFLCEDHPSVWTHAFARPTRIPRNAIELASLGRLTCDLFDLAQARVTNGRHGVELPSPSVDSVVHWKPRMKRTTRNAEKSTSANYHAREISLWSSPLSECNGPRYLPVSTQSRGIIVAHELARRLVKLNIKTRNGVLLCAAVFSPVSLPACERRTSALDKIDAKRLKAPHWHSARRHYLLATEPLLCGL